MKRTSLPSRDGQPAQDLVSRNSFRARLSFPFGRSHAAFTCLLQVWNKSDVVNPLSFVVGAGEGYLVKKGLARTCLRMNPLTDTNKRHKPHDSEATVWLRKRVSKAKYEGSMNRRQQEIQTETGQGHGRPLWRPPLQHKTQ